MSEVNETCVFCANCDYFQDGLCVCSCHKTEQHTPTPWEFAHNDGFPGFRILQSGRMLYDHLATLQGTQAKADAAFIVRAVNSHEALLETLKKSYDPYGERPKWVQDVIDQAEARP